jgi:hypothetical protein
VSDHARELLPWEVNALVDWFVFRMGPEDRSRLMADLPSVYNRIHGREIVRVVRSDETPLACVACGLVCTCAQPRTVTKRSK